MIAATDAGGKTLVQIDCSPPQHNPPPAASQRRVAVSEVMNRPAPEIVVRPARISDMRQVETIVNGFARDNLMLPRSYDYLVRLFREFVVAVDADDRVLGCGALRIYGAQLAEIVSLAVSENAHGAGIGRRIVERLLEEGRSLELRTVFALTLQERFFHRIGFQTVARSNFPGKVWADCRNCPKLHACDEIAVALELRAG